MTSSESQPRTLAGRTFLDLLNTQDRLNGEQVPVDWAHGILQVEAEAAQDSRPVDVPALIDRLYVEIEELNRAFPDLDENPLIEGRIRGVKYSIGRIKEAARLAAEEPHD